jgi:multiple sugar transport system permease protein
MIYNKANNNNLQFRAKNKTARLFVAIFRWFLIVSVSYIILFPLMSMISTALKAQIDILDPAVVWVPRRLTFDSFRSAFEVLDFGRSFLKSLEINILSAGVQAFTCAITAYGLARFNFPFKKICLVLLLLSIIIPQEMIIVSSYTQLNRFDIFGIFGAIGELVSLELRPNLINTPWAFWLPSIFSSGLRSGLFIFIYMQFFKNLPKELEEAAYIDGAGPLKTYLRIILPSSGVVFLTVTIFSVIWHWNEHYISSVYFTSEFPLAVQVSQIEMRISALGIRDEGVLPNGIIMASCLMFITPMLIMYMALQRKFIQSIDRVGIVG